MWSTRPLPSRNRMADPRHLTTVVPAEDGEYPSPRYETTADGQTSPNHTRFGTRCAEGPVGPRPGHRPRGAGDPALRRTAVVLRDRGDAARSARIQGAGHQRSARVGVRLQTSDLQPGGPPEAGQQPGRQALPGRAGIAGA